MSVVRSWLVGTVALVVAGGCSRGSIFVRVTFDSSGTTTLGSCSQDFIFLDLLNIKIATTAITATKMTLPETINAIISVSSEELSSLSAAYMLKTLFKEESYAGISGMLSEIIE